jgi:hypothetical protein
VAKDLAAYDSWDNLQKVVSAESFDIQHNYQLSSAFDALSEIQDGWFDGEGFLSFPGVECRGGSGMTDETILLRQAHPKFVSEGQVTSQAFVPFPKDDAKLSDYDGDQIRAEESHRHYTETLQNESDSVWGVTCSEVAITGLSSLPDPLWKAGSSLKGGTGVQPV